MKDLAIVIIFLFISIVSVFKTGPLALFVLFVVGQFVVMGLIHILVLQFIKIKKKLFISIFSAVIVGILTYVASSNFFCVDFLILNLPNSKINRITKQCEPVKKYCNSTGYWYEDLIYGRSCGPSVFN